jgi:spore coat-associated protein N
MNRRARPHLLILAACVVAIAGCTGTGAGGPDGPVAEIRQAQGQFEVTNSKSGQAIFQAQGLAPGKSVSGTVQLTNSGSLAGELALAQADVEDQPGAGGGLLSDKLVLAVRDVTNPNAAVTVFEGPLGAFTDRALGGIAPGQARTYSFTAHLPDGGQPSGPTSGDNAYLGAAVSVRYVWRATAPDGTAPASPGAPGGPGGQASPGAPKLTVSVRTRRLLTRGVLDVIVRCDRACRATSWAQLPRLKRTRKLRTRRRAITIADASRAGRIRLKITRRTRLALRAKIARSRRISLRVKVQARAADSSVSTLSRKVTIRRKKIAARRR